MTKNMIFVISFWLFTLTCFAQRPSLETISGIVKTTDGHPAEYISISLKNTTYGAVANENGEFEFKAPSGEYTMIVYSILATSVRTNKQSKKSFSVLSL